GISGLATAIMLRSFGLSAAVVERSHHERMRITELLPPEVQIPLVSLGIWNDFVAGNPNRAPARLSCWGSTQLDSADYIFNVFGNGWVVARPEFERMLAATAVQRGVALYSNSKVTTVKWTERKRWRLCVRDENTLTKFDARFAVIATGRSPSVIRI